MLTLCQGSEEGPTPACKGKTPPPPAKENPCLPSPCPAALPQMKGPKPRQPKPFLACRPTQLVPRFCSPAFATPHGCLFLSGWLPPPRAGGVAEAGGRAGLPFHHHPRAPVHPPAKKQPGSRLKNSSPSPPAKGGTFSAQPGCAMPASGSNPWVWTYLQIGRGARGRGWNQSRSSSARQCPGQQRGRHP